MGIYSACLNHMIPTWGVSNGSIVSFTHCCFIALDDALVEDVFWPDCRGRESISSKFAKLDFPRCIGLVMVHCSLYVNVPKWMESAIKTKSAATF